MQATPDRRQSCRQAGRQATHAAGPGQPLPGVVPTREEEREAVGPAVHRPALCEVPCLRLLLQHVQLLGLQVEADKAEGVGAGVGRRQA